MRRFVSFPFDEAKFPHVVAYLLKRLGRRTRLALVKLIYLADRRHLVQYGRPVVGGAYFALQQGPVPSLALDILEDLCESKSGGTCQVDQAFVNRLQTLIDVDIQPRYPEYFCSGEPDLDQLSETDRDVLDQICEEYGSWAPERLSAHTHSHKAWKGTPVPNQIDYSLFFEDDPHAVHAVLSYLVETQEHRDMAGRLHG